jgi:xanthine dehydrogenase iron-sulfur cluster and FAD-binding subunit A
MWHTFFRPATLTEALHLFAAHPEARLVAGGTDLVVELSRGVRPTDTLIDLTAIVELEGIQADETLITIGALATHNDIVASAECVRRALPLAQACWEVGAPPIRTRATVAGNLVTASPANDTITPLIALGAEVMLIGRNGERTLPLAEFYLGVRRTALASGEILRAIRVPALQANQRGVFRKLGLRRAQAISVVNAAVVLTFDGRQVSAARIALGCVAPTIVRAGAAEAALVGRALDAATIAEVARLATLAASPIDDVRGSADYRRSAVVALVTDALERLAAGREAADWPAAPVLLETAEFGAPASAPEALAEAQAVVNGAPCALPATKTLLDALREDAGLTGTKEGCAEGECGACAVWLNGQAVMACLVPAGQAHQAEVRTIEGLAAVAPDAAGLHPLQSAFIRHGAVQCGYCIPGMLMSGARLLAEHPQPTQEQVQAALSGNICRCTGYRKIIDAVLDAAQAEG